MVPTTPDDSSLMRRVARREADALEALYDRYSRLVFSVVLAILGDRHTAEEATLDTFMRVWRSAGSYDPERGKASTWLVSVARHHAIDLLRRGRTRPESRQVSLSDFPLAGEPDGFDPQTGAELSARRDRVQSALRKLPEEQRQALALAYFRGMTHEEIAAELRQPLGTVKTRIRLAMNRLRVLLADEADEISTSGAA